MKKINIEKLIDEINELVKSHISGLLGTYFYGSRARIDYAEESDYDVLLSFDHKLNWKQKNLIYDLIAEIEMKKKIEIDVKAYWIKDLTEVWTPFREKVMKEGIFYEAN